MARWRFWLPVQAKEANSCRSSWWSVEPETRWQCESTAKQVTAALWPSRTQKGGELHASESIRSAESRKMAGVAKETARSERAALKQTWAMPTDWFKQKLRSSVSCSLLEGASEAWSGLSIEGVSASKLSKLSMERNESTLDKIASMLSSPGDSSGDAVAGKGASLNRFTEPSKETVIRF